jgi:hypothetical protein
MELATLYFVRERFSGFEAGFEIQATEFAREAVSARLATAENPVRMVEP